MLKRLLILVILWFCFGVNFVFAQNSSNKGTDFWVAYAAHVDDYDSRMTLFLSSDVNANYKVTVNGVLIAQGTVVSDVASAVFIDPNLYKVYIATSDVAGENLGINVTTSAPISLYSVISNNARTGASLILPTAALSQEYYVFSQENKGVTNKTAYSQFTVVATKDGTLVDIKPKQNSKDNKRLADQTFQIKLNKGEVYQFQAENDLTGSYINAVTPCTPIAVFSGNTWAAFCEVPNNRIPNGGDNLYQQLFPVTAWGKNFVVAPFYNTLNGNTDIIKIIVAEDNTFLTVNGSSTTANGTPLGNPYKKGSVVEFYSKGANIIKGSLPIAVAQFQTSQTCNVNNNSQSGQGGFFLGDPEMTILNPIEQTLKKITVYSKLRSVNGVNTNINKYYLNIILKTVDISGFRLDGNPVANFTAIADGEYSYAVVDVTNSSNQHNLTGAGGFAAIAYGYGQVESYAYLAGTDLKNLKSSIQVFPEGVKKAATNFCLGTSFDFVLKLPYITDKITWNLNENAKVDVDLNPSYTTTVEDGITYYLYAYKLPSTNFQNPGNYVLKAVVKQPATAFCLLDEEVISDFDVFAPNFEVKNEVCIDEDVSFKDISPSTGGNIKSWFWDFGDQNTSTLQHPTHVYKTIGAKTVTLKVITDIGCELVVAKTTNVVNKPVAAFETNGAFCIKAPLQFVNKSTSGNGVAASYKWDFGDGNSSTDQSPLYVYKKPGTYNVNLLITSTAGCTSVYTQQFVINDIPEISYVSPKSCVDDKVAFEAMVTKGEVVAWSWDFGDNTVDLVQSKLQNPVHKFPAAGNYTVTVSATSKEGCMVSYSATVVISGGNPKPAFDVKNVDKLCTSLPVYFENKSSIAFGEISKIEWIFDFKEDEVNEVVTDLSPQLGKIYEHKYPDLPVAKDYKVVMKAYSGLQCVAVTAPTLIRVNPTPKLKLKDLIAVCRTDAPFQISIADEYNLEGVYTFSGVGISASGLFNPQKSGVGTFAIKVIYQTGVGCAEEKNFTIRVDEFPSVTIADSFDILLGGEKLLAGTAIGSDLKYKWTPAEGLSSDTVLNPLAKPTTTTKYKLTIVQNTCVFEKEITVVVHENPLIPNVFSPNGDGKNDTWNIKYLETFNHGSISIFNRYGQKVFQASPYNTPWDGKFNGADLPVATYYYIIEPNNGRKKYTGAVTILR